MVSNAQKIRKLKTILRRIVVNPENKEATLALHRLLLEDCGGRLYKYMPIREYTVPSLERRTLHVSSPVVFNDPFDSKIGLDIQSLIEATFPKEQIDLYLKDYLSVYSGEVALELIPYERKSIITRWINNQKLTEFIDNNRGKQCSNDNVIALLLNNTDIVNEIVSPLLMEIASQKGIPISPDIFQTLFQNLTEDGEKHLMENNGSYSSFIRGLGVVDDIDEIGLIEKACETVVEQPNKEASLKIADFFGGIEKDLNTQLSSLFKVCCLCTSNKNKLMWSHYADSHKGICVEYDFSELKEDRIHLFPVCYSVKRPKVPWKEAIIQSEEMQRNATARFMEALLTKDKAWEYEQEWRILVLPKECTDNISAPPISCIYLGAMCSEENAKLVAKVANKLSVPIKRMIVDRGEFELHVTSIQ